MYACIRGFNKEILYQRTPSSGKKSESFLGIPTSAGVHDLIFNKKKKYLIKQLLSYLLDIMMTEKFDILHKKKLNEYPKCNLKHCISNMHSRYNCPKIFQCFIMCC